MVITFHESACFQNTIGGMCLNGPFVIRLFGKNKRLHVCHLQPVGTGIFL